MSEWEILVDSEDISVGDLIVCERENGKTMKMKFTKIKDSKYVMLKDGLGELWHFDINSLEEIEGQDRIIIGKFEAE